MSENGERPLACIEEAQAQLVASLNGPPELANVQSEEIGDPERARSTGPTR